MNTESKLILILTLLVCLICLIFYSSLASASISTTDEYFNGGSCILTSENTWQTASNGLQKFGTVNGSYIYGAASSTVVTNGRSGYSKSSESGEGYSGSLDMSSNGQINHFDTIGLGNDFSAIKNTLCDTNGLGVVSNGTAGQYPGSQSASLLAGMMGSGTGSRYTSNTEVDDSTYTYDGTGYTPQGYRYADRLGNVEYGYNKSTTDMNFQYSQHEHSLTLSNETTPLTGAFTYTWNGFEYDEANETESSNLTESIQEENNQTDKRIG